MSDERDQYQFPGDFLDDCDFYSYGLPGGSVGLGDIADAPYKHKDGNETVLDIDYIHQILSNGGNLSGTKPISSSDVVPDLPTPASATVPLTNPAASLPPSAGHPKRPCVDKHTSSEARELSAPGVSGADNQLLQPPATPTCKQTAKPAAANKTVKTSSKALKHKCDTCSQVFDSKIALSIHTGRIHKHEGRDKNYQCTRCSKAFFNSSYLAQHMRIHTGQKPYPCPDCEKRFTQLSHLQQHKRTHTGEKPYRCQQPGCTKAFSQLSNLQSHTRSHLPDGNIHKCTSCYKCYYDEASLQAHLRTHMVNKRVRNYRCDDCGKSYTQDTYLQNHIKNKHGGTTSSAVVQHQQQLAAVSYQQQQQQQQQHMRQPTSIQAAQSMICKIEETASAPCGGGALLIASTSAPLPTVQGSKHMSGVPATPSHQSYPEPEFDVQRSFSFNAPPSDSRDVAAAAYDEGSAFKPVIRPPVFDGRIMDVNGSNLNSPYQSERQYEPTTPQHQQPPPLVSPLDNKADIELQQPQTTPYWASMAGGSASSSGTCANMDSSCYSSISSFIAGVGGYNPYSSYIGAMDMFCDKSSASGLYGNDAMCDYLMGGGLRESYQMD